MAKQILYKNHCTPQEQPDSGKYYLDSDCGRRMTGSNLLELGSDTTAFNTITATATIGSTIDFIFVKAKDIESGTVTISLDGSDTEIIKLLEGEAFASQIDPTATPKVHISGVATVEYFTGT
jgi:hypothetical protein